MEMTLQEITKRIEELENETKRIQIDILSLKILESLKLAEDEEEYVEIVREDLSDWAIERKIKESRC